MKKTILLFGICIVLLISSVYSTTDVAKYDCQTDENDAATSYCGAVSVGMRSRDAGRTYRNFLNFNITSQGTAWDSVIVELKVSTVTNVADGLNASFYYCTGAFDETMTWNTQNVVEATCNYTLPVVTIQHSLISAGDLITIDVTSLFNADGDGVFSIAGRLLPDGFDGTSRTVYIHAREAVVAGNRPVVNFTNTTTGLTTVTLQFPVNETHYNYDNYLGNITLSTDANATCEVNDTRWTLLNSNGTYFNFLNNTIIVDGNISIYANCTDTTTPTSKAETTFWFVLDNTQPPINIYHPDAGGTTNINDTNRTICVNISTNDQYLYRVNLTAWNTTGYNYYTNATTITDGTTNYTWTSCIDTSGFGYGKHRLWIQSTDSHTDQFWKGAEAVSKDDINKQLTYFFIDNEISIALIDGNVLEEFYGVDTEKLNDRYTFDFIFKDEIKPNSRLTFRITSQKKLDYIENSDYNAHFVTGMNWIDFEGVSGDYTIIKVDDYNYDIELVTDKSMLELGFKSIGGLNYNNKNVTFDVQQNLTIFVNDTNTGLYVSNFTVTVDGVTRTANGTNVTMFVDANSTHTIITTALGYVVPNTNIFVGFLPKTVILNASSGGAILYFYDEQLNVIMDWETIEIDIRPITGNTSQEYTTSTGSTTASGISNGYYEIRYSAPSYNLRSYYIDINVTGIQTINLYMLNSSFASSLDVILNDFTFTRIANVTLYIEKYFVDENTGHVVAMGITTQQGEKRFYIQQETTLYKITATYGGNIIYQSDNWEEIIDSTYTITTDINNFYTPVGTVTGGELSVINSTFPYYFNYTYTGKDTDIATVCLEVYQETVGGFTLINRSCVSAVATTIIQTLKRNNTYVAYVYLNRTNGIIIWEDSLPFKTFDTVEQFFWQDGLGLLLAIILIPSFILGTIWITRSAVGGIIATDISLLAVWKMQMVPITTWAIMLIIPASVVVAYYIDKNILH